MQDLNDIASFAAVVEHNGFSAAARVLNRPKSSISRHVDRLEARLGVRLLERSTRRIRLTEVGSQYFGRCQAALSSLEGAERDVALHRSDPVGIVRLTCPTGIVRNTLARMIPDFMALYPEVRLQIQATNQPIDLIKERIDVAIRARAQLQDESLTMRRLGASRLTLVASPTFLLTHPIASDILVIGNLPFLSFQEGAERPTWVFRDLQGTSQTITFTPVLWTSEFDILVEAACAGTGIALLPAEVVQGAIEKARLARVLPNWRTEEVVIHLVFPTARGLRPAVRVFVDYIAAHFDVGGRRD